MTEPLWERLQKAAGRVCGTAGCLMPARRIGSRCLRHDRALRRDGHESTGAVGIRELGPWIKYCRVWIDGQHAAGHRGVIAACNWIAGQAATAQPPASLHKGAAPWSRWQAWLARFHREGLDPRQVIAVCVAAHLHRLEFPRRWPDQRHFLHNLGSSIASLGNRCRVTAGKPNTVRSHRKPAGLLLFAAGEVERAFGVLSIRAAQHLHDQMQKAATPIPQAVLHAAFTTSTNTH